MCRGTYGSVITLGDDISADVVDPTPVVVATLPPPQQQEDPIFYPRKQDTLFWCLYIAHHGYPGFMAIGNKYSNIEIEEKQKIIDFLKKSPDLLKTGMEGSAKITKVRIQEIMSDLMLNKKTNMWTCMAMCLYYKIHCLVVRERTYMEIRPMSIENAFPVVLTINERDQYGIMLDASESCVIEKCAEIRSGHFLIENGEKPLRGISTYKVGDLVDIALKLKLDVDVTTIKKPELYQLLWSSCLLT
jgi:hypothetical protein